MEERETNTGTASSVRPNFKEFAKQNQKVLPTPSNLSESVNNDYWRKNWWNFMASST